MECPCNADSQAASLTYVLVAEPCLTVAALCGLTLRSPAQMEDVLTILQTKLQDLEAKLTFASSRSEL